MPAKAGTPEELAQRRVAGLLRFDDPSGHTLESFWGASLDNRPAFSPYGNRFVTGDLGMGHVVIPAADDQAAMEFYAGVLGFRLRDTMAMPPELFGRPPGGPPAMMRFRGCNPRHHSLALAPMTSPAGCIRVMIEAKTLDDVGRAMDRCARRGGKISASLGRHANDRMVSFYVQTPGGFDIEYGTDGLVRHRRAAGRRLHLGEQADHGGQRLGPRFRRRGRALGWPGSRRRKPRRRARRRAPRRHGGNERSRRGACGDRGTRGQCGEL